MIGSFEDLEKVLDINEYIMFDTETDGFYGRVEMAQFYQKGWKNAILIRRPEVYRLIKLLNDCKVVMQNAHYDITTLQANVGGLTWIPKEIHCTLLLSRLHFYGKLDFDLKSLVSYLNSELDYGDINKKDLQTSDWSAETLTDEQLRYAEMDVIFLQELWDTVKYLVTDQNYQLDLLILKYCLDFQNNGLPIDINAIHNKLKYNNIEIGILDIPDSVNVNSWQQVRKFLDSDESDDLALATMSSEGNEKAAIVRKKRKLLKENSFLNKFLNTERNGCIYGKFSPTARSGRLISKDQNLHQPPRTVKSCFGVEKQDNLVMGYSDFSQLEMRGACAVIGDSIMETLFRSGKDLHSYTADLLFLKPAPHDLKQKSINRQIAKTANFHFLYGGGIEVFKQLLIKRANIIITDQEAKKIRFNWRDSWPTVYNWQKKGIQAWKRHEPWETPLGRRYLAKRITDQMNIQIQGFGAEVSKLALHYMLRDLAKLSPDIKLRNQKHDDYLFTCPNTPELYKQMAKIIGDSMLNAWKEMGNYVLIPDLPMPIDVRIGYNLGEIEKDEFIYQYEI